MTSLHRCRCRSHYNGVCRAPFTVHYIQRSRFWWTGTPWRRGTVDMHIRVVVYHSIPFILMTASWVHDHHVLKQRKSVTGPQKGSECTPGRRQFSFCDCIWVTGWSCYWSNRSRLRHEHNAIMFHGMRGALRNSKLLLSTFVVHAHGNSVQTASARALRLLVQLVSTLP